jgi:hypothetical protein
MLCTRSDNPNSRDRHSSIAYQFARYAIDHVDRYRKAYSGRRPGTGDDRARHADQPAGAVEQGAAGIARVDRRIGLDDAADLVGCGGRQPPVQRADDAGRERLLKAIGITDGECLLPDLEVRRAANRYRLERRPQALELKHSEVIGRRHADHARIHEFTGRQSRADPVSPLDDMVVGDHVSGRVPGDSRAGLDDTLLIFVEQRILLLPPGKHVQHGW